MLWKHKFFQFVFSLRPSLIIVFVQWSHIALAVVHSFFMWRRLGCQLPSTILMRFASATRHFGRSFSFFVNIIIMTPNKFQFVRAPSEYDNVSTKGVANRMYTHGVNVSIGGISKSLMMIALYFLLLNSYWLSKKISTTWSIRGSEFRKNFYLQIRTNCSAEYSDYILLIQNEQQSVQG